MAKFAHKPHPHIEARKELGAPKVADAIEHPHPVVNFNNKMGFKITLAVGTMWCAYVFTLLALVSAPSAFSSGDKLIIVAWIAQTFIQLVLLPIIIVGQNIQAKAADQRSEATYKDAEAVLHEAQQIQEHLHAQDAEIARLVKALKEKA